MKQMIRNQKIKLVLVFSVSMCVMFSLLGIAGTDFEMLLLFLYGAEKSSFLTFKMGFLLFVILAQYLNADLILYHIKNIDYLCIRYGTKEEVFLALIKNVMFSNIAFILSSTLGTIDGFLVRGNYFNSIEFNNILVIMVRGLGFYYLMSVLQVILLLYVDEAKTFGAIALTVIIFTFVNPFTILCFTRERSGEELVCWGIFYSMVCSIATFVLKSIYMKEWGKYANRSI